MHFDIDAVYPLGLGFHRGELCLRSSRVGGHLGCVIVAVAIDGGLIALTECGGSSGQAVDLLDRKSVV